MYRRSRETVLNCWWFLGSALLFLRNETKQSSGGCSLPPLPWEPLHKQRLRKLSERPGVEVLTLRCAARHQLLVEFTESCDCCCVLNKHGDRRRWSLDLGQSVKRIWRFSQTDWFLQLCHDFFLFNHLFILDNVCGVFLHFWAWKYSSKLLLYLKRNWIYFRP